MKRHPIVEEDLAAVCALDLPWDELAGADVLVTGGAGLVAAYLVEALLFRNEIAPDSAIQVCVLARDETRARRRFAAYEGRSDLNFLVQDVCAPPPAGMRADFIVHAASPAQPRQFASDPVGTLGPNVLGTWHMLDLARRNNARSFLFVSSGEAYGSMADGPSRPWREDDFGPLDPLDVRACYGEAKRAGEMMCAAWWRQFGVPARIARLGHTFGPGIDLEDGRVFADFAGRMIRGEPIQLNSNGSAARPFCYLTDAVAGLLLILLRGAAGTAYNLVNDEGLMRIRDLAEGVAGLFPEKNLRVIYAGPSGAPVSPSLGAAVDTTRLRQLGWRPRIGVLEGFRRTVLSFQ